MRKSLIILLALISFIQISYSQSRKQEKEINHLLEQMMTAFNYYNGIKIKSMIMDDQFVKIIQGGMVLKPNYYEKIDTGVFKRSQVTFESKWINKNIRIIDAKNVVVVGEILTITTQKDKEPFETKSINSVVLQKEKGNWKIVTMHTSNLTQNRNF